MSEHRDESARLAERQRLLAATAEVQRLRLALQWRLLRHQTQPEALARAALGSVRQHSGWWLAAATLLMFAARRHRRRHGQREDDEMPWAGDLLRLARWALRWASLWR